MATEAGLTTPPIAVDSFSSEPIITPQTTMTTSSPSSTGVRTPTRKLSGLSPANASQISKTIVCTAMPPIRLPAASDRCPPAAAEIVIASSGRLPAIASSTSPPNSSPRPSRTSSASVPFDSTIPASHVATAPPAKIAMSSGVPSPDIRRVWIDPRPSRPGGCALRCEAHRLGDPARPRLRPLRRHEPEQNPLLRPGRERLPGSCGSRAGGKRREQVGRRLERLDRVEQRPRAVSLGRLDHREPGRCHRTGRRQLLDAKLVRPRPAAARLPGCEEHHRALVVEPLRLAVDPTEAERLLDHVVVAQGRPTGRLLEGDDPDAGRLARMRCEPRPPVAARRRLEALELVGQTGTTSPSYASCQRSGTDSSAGRWVSNNDRAPDSSNAVSASSTDRCPRG